jgi:hypothetical protein
MGEQARAHVQQYWNVEASIDRLEALLHEAVK